MDVDVMINRSAGNFLGAKVSYTKYKDFLVFIIYKITCGKVEVLCALTGNDTLNT